MAPSTRTINVICAAAHGLGVLYIALVPTIYDVSFDKFTYPISKKFMDTRPWPFVCKYENGTVVNGTAACPDDNRVFSITQPSKSESIGSANLLGLAMAFSAFSCAHHAIAAYKGWDTDHNAEAMNWLRLGVDYGFSAPLMLLLINMTWGANNVSGVVLAPLLLAGLLWISAWRLNARVGSNRGASNAEKGAFFSLIVFFAVALVPTIYAVGDAVSEKKAGNLGKAPPFVPVFAALVIASFSSFIWPYSKQFFASDNKGEDGGMVNKDITYAILSIVSKTSLLALLSFGAIQQIKMTQGDQPASQSKPLQSGLIAVVVVIVVGALLGALFAGKFDTCTCRRGATTGASFSTYVLFPSSYYESNRMLLWRE